MIYNGINVESTCGKCKNRVILSYGYGDFDYDKISEQCLCQKCNKLTRIDAIKFKNCDYYIETIELGRKCFSKTVRVQGEREIDDIPDSDSLLFHVMKISPSSDQRKQLSGEVPQNNPNSRRSGGGQVTYMKELDKTTNLVSWESILRNPAYDTNPQPTQPQRRVPIPQPVNNNNVKQNYNQQQQNYPPRIQPIPQIPQQIYNQHNQPHQQKYPPQSQPIPQIPQQIYNQPHQQKYPPHSQPIPQIPRDQYRRDQNVYPQQHVHNPHQQNQRQPPNQHRDIKQRITTPLKDIKMKFPRTQKTTKTNNFRFKDKPSKSREFQERLKNLKFTSLSKRRQDSPSSSSPSRKKKENIFNKFEGVKQEKKKKAKKFELIQKPRIEPDLKPHDRPKMSREMLKQYEFPDKDITIISSLGKGSYGSVYKAKWDGVGGGIFVAVKEIAFGNDVETRENIMIEYMIMLKMNFQKVIRVYGFTLPVGKVRILMELMEGDLMGLVKKNELTVYQKFKLMKKMTQGINFLHARHLVHRDVKSYNFLYKKDEIVITDFGLALDVDPQESGITAKYGGTLRWMSPELISNKRPKFKFSTDIYALGVTFWEIIFEGIPFSDIVDDNELIRHVKVGNRPKMNDPNLPIELKGLMAACMYWNYQQRPSAQHILEWFEVHEEFFKTNYNRVIKFRIMD